MTPANFRGCKVEVSNMLRKYHLRSVIIFSSLVSEAMVRAEYEACFVYDVEGSCVTLDKNGYNSPCHENHGFLVNAPCPNTVRMKTCIPDGLDPVVLHHQGLQNRTKARRILSEYGQLLRTGRLDAERHTLWTSSKLGK